MYVQWPPLFMHCLKHSTYQLILSSSCYSPALSPLSSLLLSYHVPGFSPPPLLQIFSLCSEFTVLLTSYPHVIHNFFLRNSFNMASLRNRFVYVTLFMRIRKELGSDVELHTNYSDREFSMFFFLIPPANFLDGTSVTTLFQL